MKHFPRWPYVRTCSRRNCCCIIASRRRRILLSTFRGSVGCHYNTNCSRSTVTDTPLSPSATAGPERWWLVHPTKKHSVLIFVYISAFREFCIFVGLCTRGYTLYYNIHADLYIYTLYKVGVSPEYSVECVYMGIYIAVYLSAYSIHEFVYIHAQTLKRTCKHLLTYTYITLYLMDTYIFCFVYIQSYILMCFYTGRYRYIGIHSIQIYIYIDIDVYGYRSLYMHNNIYIYMWDLDIKVSILLKVI